MTTLAQSGMLSGFPDGRFHGGRQVTRYETAALLCRLQSRTLGWQGLAVATRPSRAWRDLPPGHWAASTVTTAVEGFGWLAPWPGIDDGYFRGGLPANRYELAVAAASLLPPAAAAAPDLAAPAWARAAVARLSTLGVMVGDPDGRFHGERAMTRYEAAVAFAKALAIAAPKPTAAPVVAVPDAPAAPLPGALPEPLLPAPQPGPPAGQPLNLPRIALGFVPEYLSELGDAPSGEAKGWALASSQVQADWADGPLALTASWRYAMYGLTRSPGITLPRRDQQLQAGAGYRWQWGLGERRGEISVYGLGCYLGRQAGSSAGDDLLALDMQAFGLGAGMQLRWPVARRLLAAARVDYFPLLGTQFGDRAEVVGQLGTLSAVVGLDWYLDRLSVGLGYRLRYLYDGQGRYSLWGNGLVLRAGLAI